MEINNVSKKLKELRLKKGYSLEEISQMIPVSKQGYHFWEQGLRAWKLETLTILSKILDFEISISNGILSISESFTKNYKSEVNIMLEKRNLNESERFKVIVLYTGADNINFEEKEILEDILIYSNKKDAQEMFKTDSLIPIYALYDNEEGRICFNTYGLDKTRAYTKYYWNYAPVLDDDNTVYIDIKKNIKISKKYVTIDVDNISEDGKYPILFVSNEESERTLGMFTITDLNDCIIPGIDYASESFPQILLD